MGLTARQREVVGFLMAGMVRDGKMPTLRAVMDFLGSGSPNGAVCHMMALRKKGVLELRPDRSKGDTSPYRFRGVVGWHPVYAEGAAGDLLREIAGGPEAERTCVVEDGVLT